EDKCSFVCCETPSPEAATHRGSFLPYPRSIFACTLRTAKLNLFFCVYRYRYPSLHRQSNQLSLPIVGASGKHAEGSLHDTLIHRACMGSLTCCTPPCHAVRIRGPCGVSQFQPHPKERLTVTRSSFVMSKRGIQDSAAAYSLSRPVNDAFVATNEPGQTDLARQAVGSYVNRMRLLASFACLEQR
ncbi:hypothetical protein CH063_07458, partial [Colletotrichum higginsianum]